MANQHGEGEAYHQLHLHALAGCRIYTAYALMRLPLCLDRPCGNLVNLGTDTEEYTDVVVRCLRSFEELDKLANHVDMALRSWRCRLFKNHAEEEETRSERMAQ